MWPTEVAQRACTPEFRIPPSSLHETPPGSCSCRPPRPWRSSCSRTRQLHEPRYVLGKCQGPANPSTALAALPPGPPPPPSSPSPAPMPPSSTPRRRAHPVARMALGSDLPSAACHLPLPARRPPLPPDPNVPLCDSRLDSVSVLLVGHVLSYAKMSVAFALRDWLTAPLQPRSLYLHPANLNPG